MLYRVIYSLILEWMLFSVQSMRTGPLVSLLLFPNVHLLRKLLLCFMVLQAKRTR